MQIGHNLKQLAISADQFFNVLIFSTIKPQYRQWADETMSAHCWRLEKDHGITWPRKLIDTIMFFDKDHCRTSYESEVERSQLPPSLR